MTKSTPDKLTTTEMFFQPAYRRSRRLQLQVSERRLLLMLGDALAVVASVLFGLRVWAWVAEYEFTLAFILPQSYLFFVMVVLWFLLANANDLYELRIAGSRGRTFQRLLIVNLEMVIIYVLVFFFSPRDALPRLFVLYYAVASFVTIGIWRFARPVLLGWASQPRRTLIVGSVENAPMIIETLRAHASHDYDLRGIIGASNEVGSMALDVPVIGTGADLMNFIARDGITELIIMSTRNLDDGAFQAVMDAYERGITLMPMARLFEEITGRVPVEHISDDWAMVLLPMQNTNSLFQINQVIKRVLDIGLSLIGLVVFGVMLPFIALIIRLDSKGSIFYSQPRVGLNGRVFQIYKLRSMVDDAEAQTGAIFSRVGDPRVTRVGRIMRKSRLDELPQLWNVLKGDMSLIGPRPERPEHVSRLTEKIPFYRTRLIVRPGVSGWAQVMYGYGANDDDALVKLQYDLYYIRHQSLLLDLNILLRTVGKAIMFKGV